MSPFLKQEPQPPWLAQFSPHKASLSLKFNILFCSLNPLLWLPGQSKGKLSTEVQAPHFRESVKLPSESKMGLAARGRGNG